MKKLLFFLLAILFAIQGYGQTVQTSFGTATQSYIPIYTFYGYTYSQQIVTNAELVAGGLGTTYGQIVKIRWHWNGSGNFTNCNDWKIYIGHTTKTSFASSTDWEPLTSLTLVYDSLLTAPTAAGWFEFILQTPFTYNGTDNLIIAVDENTASYGSTAYYTSQSAASRGIYYYSDSTNPDPAAPPSGTVTSNIPNVQLYFMETCPGPINVTASTITDNSATINWTPFGAATVFNLEYKEASASTWTTITGINTTSYTIPSLTPNTNYQVRLQADCNTETSVFTMPFNFTTSLIPVTLPYFNDFENSATYTDLGLNNGTQKNKWVISNAPGVNATTNGEYALYISNNDTTNAWAYTSGTAGTSRVYAMMDVVVPAGVNEVKLDFDWIANGNSAANEFLRVYWLPTNIPITAGQNPPTVASVNYDLTAMIGNYTNGFGQHWLSRQTTWQHAQFSINTTQFPDLAGNTWRLLIHWRNDQTTAAQPPATVDNLSLVVSNCVFPAFDSIVAITSTSADLYFTENGTASAWNAQYRILGTTQWTTQAMTASPFTLSGLQPSTSYEIRIQSDCISEQSSFSPIRKINTLCGPITAIPWVDYFDNYGTGTTVFPACWTRKSNVTNRPYISSTNFTSPGSMYFYCGSSGNYNIASTPMIDVSIPLNTLMLNFRTYFSGTDDTLYVGVMSNPNDETTFTEIAKYVTSNTATWINQVLYLNNYQGTAQYISLRTKYGATSSAIYVDNFRILPLPTCMMPHSYYVNNIDAYEATVNWTSADLSNNEWYLYYKPTSSSIWDSIQVYGPSYILTNLTANTSYQYYLRTVCGSDFSDATNIATFRTACIPFDIIPFTENFDSYASSSFPPCWNYLTTYSTAPYISTTNFSAPNSLCAPVSSGYYTYLIAPIPDASITVNQLQVKFQAKGASGENIQVGIMENISNPASFVPIQTIPITASWTEYTAYLTNYTGSGNRIAFKMAPTVYVSYYIDNVEINNAPTCLPVNSLNVSYVSGSSAYVTWVPNGTPDYFTVAVSVTGSGVWNTYTTTNSNYILTGLNELTNYTVQVSPNCSGFEGLTTSFNFVTNCNVGGAFVVGTPNATTSTNGNYLPSYLCYEYAYSQQIFYSSEIITDSIFGIGFQYFYGTPDTRNITVYLGHTSQSSFTSVSNYVPLDSLTQVFQGSVTFSNVNEQNWVNINFTAPFTYDGIRNLVLVVRDMTGDWSICSETFRTHNTTATTSMYFYQDYTSINPASPSATNQNVVSFRNNVKFLAPCSPVSCVQPNVIVSNVGVYDADMIIIPGGSETSWEGEYKKATETTWTSLGTVSVSNFNISLLDANTTYNVRFRQVCSPTDMSPWKTVTFTTDCGTISQIPFVENFDTYGQGTNIIPSCWVRHTTAGAYPYITTTPFNGPYSLYFYSTSSTYSMIVLPPLDPTVALNTLQLNIYARNSSMGDNLKVGVMTNPNDPTTFSLIGTLTPSVLNTYQELFISFANYSDTGRYIALRSDNMAQSLSNNLYLDSLKLDLIPSCSKPANVLFSFITTTSATATWNPSPTAVSYEVVYGLPGVDPATETPIPVADTFFVMTPLTATTLYHFYVRSVCSGGVYSDWTNLRTFSTVALAPVPYTEGFTSTSIPVGYNLTRFSVGSLTYVPGNPANNLYANLYSSYPTGVISTINIGPLQTNYELAFEYSYANYSGGGAVTAGSGNFVVAISTDWGNTYTNVDTVVNNGLAGYQNYSFDLSAYDTQILKIKITGNWISGDYYLGIDNIYVGPAITCPTPSALVTSNPSTTSIDLGWTENGTATEWQIEYGAPGFSLGTGTQITVNTHPYTIPALTSSSIYDFYVRSICGVGDTSIWSTKVIGGTAQIPAQVPVTFDFETTSGFQFANNPSGNNWYIGAATNNTTGGTNAMYISNDNGVTNAFTNNAPVIVWAYRDLQFPTSTADFTLTFDWKALAESCCDYLNVYIGDVTTPIAVATSSTITAPAGTDTVATKLNSQIAWQTVTYTLPAATYSGQVKRIYFGWRNDSSLGDNPPAAVDNIAITSSTPVCAIPTNLAVNGVTSSTATATWSAGGTETQWQIAYKPTASSTWMTAFVSPLPSYAIPSLLAATAYDVKVRAICGAGDTSAYTAVVNFTTLATSCPAPTNLAATAITTTGATITWTPGGSETAWELDYKLATASTWTTVNVSAPTHVLNTLVASTNYNVRVRAVCGSSNLSDNTAIVNFTTATPPCLVPTNVLVPTATITDQSAVVTWTAAAGQTQWQVEYKLVSSANWTTMAVSTSTTQPIQALQSNSTYEVRVKALCSATNESPFTTPVQFTTTGAATYTITATANGPGTISPSGTVLVAAGANQTFTFTPTGTASVVALMVDNQSTPNVNNQHTFSNVLANHTISVDFAEGIDENSIANMVQLYPNPTNAFIEIRLDEAQLQVKECRVYDIYGKLINIVPVHTDITKIDVNHLAAGVYFVRMNSEKGTITKKFVKK